LTFVAYYRSCFVLCKTVTEILFKSKIPQKEENKIPPNAKI